MDWEYVPHEDVDLKGSLVVVGMPSVRAIGLVAVSFLVDHLRMRTIGGVQSDALPPVGTVRKGVVSSPIQAWATELVCGVDGKCDRLVVIRSDLPIRAEHMLPIADLLGSWARDAHVSLVVGLDAYGVDAERPGDARGVLVAASREGEKAERAIDAKPLESAVVTGFTPALLLRANRYDVPALGVFAPLAAGGSEAEAATQLLHTIAPLVSKIELSPDDLGARMRSLDDSLRESRVRHAREAKMLDASANQGYA